MFAATRPEDLASRETLLSMSGLDFMRAILDGTLSQPPITQVMDYALDRVADGEVAFRGTPAFRHCNPMGGVHGGWYGTLLDSCMACAVMTKVPKGAWYSTLEYKINVTRALPVGVEVLAIGTVDHAGRSTAVAHGILRGAADGRLYATGSTTCLIMTPR
ncbi:PaaI family thioesterase [Rhodobacteraceae bacterium CCMM004]|nr:PaaI family thioesterase [Rhodobacteraceae bacterium CCMM004]